jgi:hypothetical protein
MFKYPASMNQHRGLRTDRPHAPGSGRCSLSEPPALSDPRPTSSPRRSCTGGRPPRSATVARPFPLVKFNNNPDLTRRAIADTSFAETNICSLIIGRQRLLRQVPRTQSKPLLVLRVLRHTKRLCRQTSGALIGQFRRPSSPVRPPRPRNRQS